MKISISQKHKSIPENLEFELPDFCILTGKNGSGKSHLLEAIANNAISSVTSEGIAIRDVLLVGYNGLNPQVDDRCDAAQLVQNAQNWWQQLQTIIQHYKLNFVGKHQFQDIDREYVVPHHGPNPTRSAIIRRVLEKTGKDLHQITEEDLYNNINFADSGSGSLFFSQCAMIFKAYHVRWTKNKFNKFLMAEGEAKNLTFLSEEEFVHKYGPAPWDLINEILKKANLPYEFLNPNIGDVDLAYILKLVDRSTDNDISVNDLSSGEKVLMSLALAIYNTHEGGSRPQLLLLDEPDAPLHPEYSKLLIETLMDTLVNLAKVKVIMTTHSPATVAMAPDNSVYEIQRDTKKPVMVSNSKAVSTLTEGIGFLRVSYEKRRQIFVESKYDVLYFEKIFYTLNRKHQFGYQPIFLEPHSGSSNCTDVINIVSKLSEAGSDLIYGIIDFDGKNQATNKILVLGQNKRYAIENYLLEPLYVVLALIRYGKCTYTDFGVTNYHTYPEAVSLTISECQTLVDNFILKLGLPLHELTSVTLENGYEINYPRSFLMHQGHSYETLVQDKFMELNAISKGKGDSGLKLGLAEVIAEFPQFLPREISELFLSLDQKL